MAKKPNEDGTKTKKRKTTRKKNNKEQVVTVAIERDSKETSFKLTIPNPERKRNKDGDSDQQHQEAVKPQTESASTAS